MNERMRADMTHAARQLLGPGYADDYYEQVGADFAEVADHYMGEQAKRQDDSATAMVSAGIRGLFTPEEITEILRGLGRTISVLAPEQREANRSVYRRLSALTRSAGRGTG